MAFGWVVLALVFLDELLAVAVAYVWGQHASGWLLGVVAALGAVTAWFLFASPEATYGGPVVGPVAKVLVFGLAALGLWVSGHPTAALGLLVFSVVVNAVAQVPSIKSLAEQESSAWGRAP